MEQLLKNAKADVAAQNGYASWSSIMHKVLFIEEVAQQYAELCLQEVRRRIDGAWSFDNNQTHTHNWHTKQDFLEWLDKYAGQPGDDGWIPVTDVDRLPKNSDDWYIVARGEIIGLIGHHYLNGSWFGYGCATATEGITHFRKFPEGAEKRMEVMEGFYTVYHVRSYKEKEGYFPEEYIKRIETFLRNEFPVAFFRKRHKENAGYRQSICYLLECFRINIGPSRIGKMFNQNHATVIHSRKVVSEEWLECAGYEDKVEILKIVKVKLMPFLVHMEFEFKNRNYAKSKYIL